MTDSAWDKPGALEWILPIWQGPWEQKVRRERSFEVMKTVRGGLLLDAGCGAGTYVPHLAVAGLRPARYLGVDGSERMIEHARLANPAWNFDHHDLTGLPYGDDAFDYTLLADVVQHQPDEIASEILQQVARVTKQQVLCYTWLESERWRPHQAFDGQFWDIVRTEDEWERLLEGVGCDFYRDGEVTTFHKKESR